MPRSLKFEFGKYGRVIGTYLGNQRSPREMALHTRAAGYTLNPHVTESTVSTMSRRTVAEEDG